MLRQVSCWPEGLYCQLSPVPLTGGRQKKESSLLKGLSYEWNSADWELLPNISSFYHLSPDACTSVCVKPLSRYLRPPGRRVTQNKRPLLFCTCSSWGRWSEVMLLRLHDTCTQITAFCLSHTHPWIQACTHTGHIQRVQTFLSRTNSAQSLPASSHLQLRLALLSRSIKISKDYPYSLLVNILVQ